MEKSKKSINVEGGFLFCGGWKYSKSLSMDPTFIREMRVMVIKESVYVLYGWPLYGRDKAVGS